VSENVELFWHLSISIKPFLHPSPAPLQDDFIVAVDSYQKRVYQISLTDGQVAAINKPPYKPVALDIHPVTKQLYWTDNAFGAIITSDLYGNERVFRKLPPGM